MKPQNYAYWDKIKAKYEERNRDLQQKERELRNRVTCMQAILGSPTHPSKSESNADKRSVPGVSRINYFSNPSLDEESKLTEPMAESLNASQEVKSANICKCPPDHYSVGSTKKDDNQGGFFNCLRALLPMSSNNPKYQAEPTEPPTKDIFRECFCQGSSIDDTVRIDVGVSAAEMDTQPVRISVKESSNASDLTDESCTCDPCIYNIYPDSDKESKAKSSTSKTDEEKLGSICKCSTEESIEAITKSLQESMEQMEKSKSKSVESTCSSLSLKSMDLYYLKNIYELVVEQKGLMKHVKELEDKDRVYNSVLKEFGGVSELSRSQTQCPCCAANNRPPESDKSISELKLENLLLRSELKDMRLDIRQYIEKMEGPMLFKIESEKYKCLQLEEKLEQAAKELADTHDLYQKELHNVKIELCNANANVKMLSETNDRLGQEFSQLQANYAQLENDLMRQKLLEAEIIKKLSDELKIAQRAASQRKESCNLFEVARELSKTLKECEPCEDCRNVPSDLTTTAQYIKELADLIEGKIPKSSSIKDCTCKNICSDLTTAECKDIKSASTTQREDILATAEYTTDVKSTSSAQRGSGDVEVTESKVSSYGLVMETKTNASEPKIEITVIDEISSPKTEDIPQIQPPAVTDSIASDAITEQTVEPTTEKAAASDSKIAAESQRSSKLSQIRSEPVPVQEIVSKPTSKTSDLGSKGTASTHSRKKSELAPIEEIESKQESQLPGIDTEQISKAGSLVPSKASKTSKELSRSEIERICKCLEKMAMPKEPVIKPESEKKPCKCLDQPGRSMDDDTLNKEIDREISKYLEKKKKLDEEPDKKKCKCRKQDTIEPIKRGSIDNRKCKCAKQNTIEPIRRTSIDNKKCKCSKQDTIEPIRRTSIDNKKCKCSKQDTIEPIKRTSIDNKKCICRPQGDSIEEKNNKCRCVPKDEEVVSLPPQPPETKDSNYLEIIEEVVAEPPVLDQAEDLINQQLEIIAAEDVDQLWPTNSERLRVTHQVDASKSKDRVKSTTSIKCLRVKENFPFEVDTRVDVLERPPDGVHITTTITKSGLLEVITEGPEGVIETTLIYTQSGNVEVITEIKDYGGSGRVCNIGKIMAPLEIEPSPDTQVQGIGNECICEPPVTEAVEINEESDATQDNEDQLKENPAIDDSQTDDNVEDSDKKESELEDEAKEATEEIVDEATEETVDETTDEPVDETTDETVDETPEETVDETTEETGDEATEEAVDEAAAPKTEEVAMQPQVDSKVGSKPGEKTISLAVHVENQGGNLSIEVKSSMQDAAKSLETEDS